MQNFHQRTTAPCIVNEGILINKTDIVRAIETLESVRYSFIVDGTEMSAGNGVVVKVFASPDSSTLIVNECIFVNISSFNYLRFFVDEEDATVIELIEDSKVLQLTAIENNSRSGLSNRNIFSDHCFDEETHAELFDETDDDEHRF